MSVRVQISANKVADGREISMDCVAKPTRYEPPGFEPTPREPRAGWLSTIVPRRCVHHHAFLLTPASVLLDCQGTIKKSKRGAAGAIVSTPGIEPTPSGTKPPCTSSMLRYRCGRKPETKTTTLQWKIPPPVLCGRALTVYQEQQLFMGRLAPSPPRFATGCDDGAHYGAGPPCIFRYARI